jgi:malate dehydrogenase (oxaloacetate-decarboxylating)(NADP+)
VAQRPIADMDAYREQLQTFVYASGTDEAHLHGAKAAAKRVAYAEGEEERVLRAADRGGRAGPPDADRPPGRDAQRIEKFGLRLKGATTTWSTSSTTTATATSGRPTTA